MRHQARTQSSNINIWRSERNALMADETMADATHPSNPSAYPRLPASPHADSQTLAIELGQFRGNTDPLERFAPGPVVNPVHVKPPV
jgi:hypothetical protein